MLHGTSIPFRSARPVPTVERVQSLLETKRLAGERDREHRHYPKGSLWCGACHHRGREHRPILTRAKGNGGEYYYFRCRCRCRLEKVCTESYALAASVEEAVAHHMATIRFSPEFIASVRATVHSSVADWTTPPTSHRSQPRTELARREAQEENLIDLAADGSLPSSKIRQRLHNLATKREHLSIALRTLDPDLTASDEAALQLRHVPAGLYRQVPQGHRRQIIQASSPSSTSKTRPSSTTTSVR